MTEESDYGEVTDMIAKFGGWKAMEWDKETKAYSDWQLSWMWEDYCARRMYNILGDESL